jgi:hypothetical protein
MFPFLAPLLGKLTASAIGKAAIGGVVSAVAGNIGRKTTNPRIDFQAMRDDAQRAGFNPLTVMRNGGMSGYMIPAMSKQSLAGQMLGGAMTGAFDAWANKDIDEYNAEVRRLDLEQRRADLSYISRMTGQISSQRYSDSSQISGSMLSLGDNVTALPPLSPVSVEMLVPGTGKTLDEILAQNPVDVSVSKTADGSYVNNNLQAQLFPMVTPAGNTVYVPWDPQDADLGAIAGGVISYGAFSAFDWVKSQAQRAIDSGNFGFNNPNRAASYR